MLAPIPHDKAPGPEDVGKSISLVLEKSVSESLKLDMDWGFPMLHFDAPLSVFELCSLGVQADFQSWVRLDEDREWPADASWLWDGINGEAQLIRNSSF